MNAICLVAAEVGFRAVFVGLSYSVQIRVKYSGDFSFTNSFHQRKPSWKKILSFNKDMQRNVCDEEAWTRLFLLLTI